MRPLPILLVLLLLPIVVFTQSTLTGSITDDRDVPLGGATVVLYSLPDSVFVRGEVCDQQGVFAIDYGKTEAGYLQVSALGYAAVWHELQPGQDEVRIRLREESAVLDEIQVSARRTVMQQRADRLIINPGSQVTAAGGTALDFLEKSPGVAVNRVNQSLSLNGREGVLLMINGKIRRLPADGVLQLLQGISLNDVDKLELINNPPAQYEAGGSGGIIHIITKSGQSTGLSGNFGVGLNYLYGLGGQVNGSLQWNTPNLQGYASYASAYERANVDWYENLRVPAVNTAAKSHIERIEDRPVHNLSLGLTYLLAENTTAEFLLTGYRSDFRQRGTNAGSYRQAGPEEVIFQSDIYEENVRSLGTAYLGVTQRMGEKHRLSGSLEYIYSHQDQPSEYANRAEEVDDSEISASKINPLTSWIGKLDYAWDLSQNSTLQFGTKYNTSYFDNRVEILETTAGNTTRIDALSNRSELEERILAVYASGRWRFGKRWSLRTGLRTERTLTDLVQDEVRKVVDRDYTNWFVNLSAEYEIDERQRLSVSYGERIARPTFNDLAPFVFYPNPVTVFYGNPTLLPSQSRTAGLRYSRGALGLGLEYSSVKNVMVSFHPDYDPELNLMFRFTKNLDRHKMLRLQVNLPVSPTDWLEWQSSLFLIYNRIIPRDGAEALTNPELSYQGNLNVSLPHGLSLGAGGNFYLRQNWGNFYQLPYGHLDLGLTKKFSPSNASLSLTFVDVFDTFRFDFNPLDGALADVRVNTVFIRGMQGVRLSFSMPFGSNKVKRKVIDTGSEEEKGRLN